MKMQLTPHNCMVMLVMTPCQDGWRPQVAIHHIAIRKQHRLTSRKQPEKIQGLQDHWPQLFPVLWWLSPAQHGDPVPNRLEPKQPEKIQGLQDHWPQLFPVLWW